MSLNVALLHDPRRLFMDESIVMFSVLSIAGLGNPGFGLILITTQTAAPVAPL
jgi:hypothetical protein